MKNLLSILLLTFSTFSVFGQDAVNKTPLCTNQTVEKISSRGVRLGMPLQETLNLFAADNKLTAVKVSYPENGGAAITSIIEMDFQPTIERSQEYAKKNFGYSSFALSVKNKTNFEGISHYYLGFLDNRLTYFSVHYLKPKWESQNEFVKTLSEILNLPVQENFSNNSPYSVKCGDFTVGFRTDYIDEARYSMSVSANVDEILTQRRKKAEDEQKEKDIKAFRP